MPCIMSDCSNKIKARGLCNKHYIKAVREDTLSGFPKSERVKPAEVKARLEVENSILNERILKLSNILSAAEEKIHDMDGEIKRQREEIEKLKEKLSDHEKRISTLEEEKSVLVDKNSILSYVIETLKES